MRIDKLCLTAFRNYLDQTVRFSQGINVITGKNAQGKTNLLEAVHYLTGGVSFRAASDRELITFGQEETELSAEINGEGRDQTIEIRFGVGRKKRASANGVRLKNVSELAGRFTAVLFCPEDLAIIQSSPAYRRKLLDGCLCQMRPRYAALLTEYRRLYEGKTRILKDRIEGMISVLREYDEGMCRTGAEIVRYRASVSALLAQIAADTHRGFSGGGEELSVEYQTVGTVTDPRADRSVILEQLAEHMKIHREAEWASGRCLSGVHKDDLTISINGREARKYASQGQARTAAISLKMAEREILKRDTGEYPVLLLDDVLSELDPMRQEYLLNWSGTGQVLITCCEEQEVAEKTGGRILRVDAGSVSENG